MLISFLAGLAIALTYFAITWAISARVNNYGFLDVAWSYGVLILAPLYGLFSHGSALWPWVFRGIGMIWSLRLGSYILLRVLKHHPQEDARYASLRNQWKGPWMFLLFFELQAVVVAIFSLPFLFVSFDPRQAFSSIQHLGLFFAACAICGEALSDRQMRAFKARPENKDRVCQAGLWKYSRHPNYFFESMVWWAFFFVALPTPYGWTTIVCPLLMLYFLWKVTGIPLTEEYALKSKGAAYQEYQRTTSAFIPWFKKHP